MGPWGARLRRVARTRLDARHALARFTSPEAGAGDPWLAPGVRVYRDGNVLVDRSLSPVHLASQFIEDAATYHERNFERLDFVDLIDRCLGLACVERRGPLTVLDIGSAGGASVFAACRLLPQATVVASDISPSLLARLVRFVASRDELRDRVHAYCFDLHRRFFRVEAFDLVIGAAVVHHLLDPEAALRHVAASVKPGGRMVFVEPLEAGSLVLATICARVLEELERRGERDGVLAQRMRAFRTDIRCRLGVPTRSPQTPLLDDKWVFDGPYVAALARALGMSSYAVHPVQADLEHVFEAAFRSTLADAGHAALSIPDCALEAVREFDRAIDATLKARLCPTGIIVFTK